ncbi:MAG: condensation domain-containing protein, partial [Gordonia sp. (in: high G+C Gram-positive bacteria)]
ASAATGEDAASAATGDDAASRSGHRAGGHLVVAIHHLGVDAVSWQTIITDCATAWAHLSAGQQVVLPPTGTSLRRWADVLVDLAGRDDELELWRRQLAASRPVGRPLERARDRQSTVRTRTRLLGPELSAALLTEVPAAFRCGVDTPLVAALAHAVAATDPADPRPVGFLLEGHGREEQVAPARADLARSVGWFTSLIPLSVPVVAGADGTGADVAATVKAVKDTRAGLPDHGVAFGSLRYLRPDSPLADLPLPAISVNYFGAVADSEGTGPDAPPFLPVPGVPVLPQSVTGRMAAFAALGVTVSMLPTGAGRVLRADFAAPAAVLDEAELDELAAGWERTLADLAGLVADGGEVGLSESDVPATGLAQTEIDALAAHHPGADLWPLSPLQQGLLFQSEIAIGPDDLDVYLVQVSIEIASAVDEERMRRAAAALFRRHPVLRSAYVRTATGTPVAVIPPDVEPDWTTVDLTDLDEATANARLAEITAAQRTTRFDLSRPGPIRFVLVGLPSGVRRLVITHHHILLDGWSGPLVIADLFAAYLADAPLPAPIGPGADFHDFLDWLSDRDHAAATQQWRTVLEPLTGPTLIAPALGPARGEIPATCGIDLDTEAVARLHRFSREHGVTPSTAIQVAWGVLLAQVTGQQAVVFGETVAGRPAELDGVETAVGLFINTIPVVVDAHPDRTLGDLAATLQETKTRLLDHQHVSLAEITEIAGQPTLFDTLTVYESYPVDADALTSGSRSAGLDITAVDVADATHYPLNLIVAPRGAALHFDVTYLPSAVPETQARRLADAFCRILDRLVTAPATIVADVDTIDPADRALVETFSAGPQVPLEATTLADQVAAQWASTPEAIALRCGDRSVTYREFGARVTALAEELIGRGVGPDVAVGVCLPRSVELLVGIHAVVAAGGRYVPIDPDTPADRVAYLLDTTAAALVLTGTGPAPAALATQPIPTLTVDATTAVDLDRPAIDDARRLGTLRPEHGAYTLFTSGSTGR